MKPYEKLFTPVQIGSMTLKNRVVMAPMATIAEADGGISQIVTEYYIERAKGGVGMITFGAMTVTDKYGASINGRLDAPIHVSRLNRLAEGVQRYGAKLCVQFTIGNGRCGCNNPQNPPFSASAVPTMQFPDVLCKELPKDDIRFLVEQTGRSAAIAKQAGVDAVMLHAYAGYLLDQFQSAEWNKRTDEYGGSVENRMRFTTELVQSIKKSCGEKFPVIVKFSVVHGTEGGRQLAEGLEMAKLLEKAGADAIMVDGGSFETLWNYCIPTVYEKEGFSISLAEAVKQAVSIPVIGQNKMSDPALADAAVRDGKCDLIGLGHAVIADPFWAKKAAAGNADSIRPCIGCNECFLCIATAKNYACAVNPYVSHEKDPYFKACPDSIRADGGKKKVLVVGGGPAGVIAATTAVECGHAVELWEKDAVLGGNTIAAGAPSFKGDVRKYVDYLNREIEKSAVTVRLNTEATAGNIAAAGFDAVILASGARNRVLANVDGMDRKNVHSSLKVLTEKPRLGKRVVVVGGGLVGCETALAAAMDGAEVTILEYLPGILMIGQEARNNMLALKTLLKKHAITIICNAEVMRVTDGGVTYRQDGAEHAVPCDDVVMAVGFTPNNELAGELENAGVAVTVVGDAKGPRKIIHAVKEGLFAALEL